MPAPDGYGYGTCDWCREPGELARHPSGKYACLDCQTHPQYPGGPNEWHYILWLRERGLDVDGWMTGWRTASTDVP